MTRNLFRWIFAPSEALTPAGVLVLALAAPAACTGAQDAQNLLTAPQVAEDVPAPEEVLSPPPGLIDRRPDFAPPGPSERIVPAPAPDNCPIEKMRRADYGEVRAAKASLKAERLELEKASPPQLPAPSDAQLARQARFVQIVAEHRAELDAMPDAERARAYDNLKAATFAE